MATKPSSYIDNVKIGSNGTPAQIAAPYIITKKNKDGSEIPDPANYKFLDYYDIKPDFSYTIPITNVTQYTIMSTDDWTKYTPSVTFVDTTGEIGFGKVEYFPTATPPYIKVTFSEAVSGTIYIN